jgi:hypothetical protein
MNFLKNLMIIAVLAAVGYGVYVSLARNNADPGQPPGVAEGWPVVPKVELPGAKSSASPSGPLALSGGTGRTGAGTTPPLVPSLPATLNGTSLPTVAGPTSAAPAVPYGSSAPSSPINPSSSSMAALGSPLSPDGVSAMPKSNLAGPSPTTMPPTDTVCNLTPPPELSALNATSPKPTNPADAILQGKFVALMLDVQKALDDGKFAEAHLALSHLYGKADLPAEQSKQITALLDQLAGTVIYSRQYYLEPPYVIQQGETIETIAQKYSVPWELLARINGMISPTTATTDLSLKDRPLPAKMELKVVRGPFDAVVNLDKYELTLLLQGRYAGRFPIAVGRDQPTLEGSYTVREKALNPAYYGPDGVTINANDPRNPLGHAWIGLTDSIGIHGVADPQAIGRSDNRGAIGVGDRDLQDLYGILSVGSRVTVMR